MSNDHEGGQCHVPFSDPGYTTPKPNHNLKFFNADGEEVATLDFNGPGLAFEGIADEAAIVFVNWIAEAFKARLDEEYQRGFKEGRKYREAND